MARPSSVSNVSRLATSTTLMPDAAICRVNSLPIPDEAPVTSAHGPNCPLSSAAFIVLFLSVDCDLLLCDLVDPLGIERDVSFDLRNSRIRVLIRPHRMNGLLSSSGNAVVIAIAFIRTVGNVIGPFQLSKIDIFTGNVLNGRIVGFPKCQRVAGVRDHTAHNRHDNASRIALDRNRMIRIWNFDLFFLHVLFLFWYSSDC